MQERVFTLAFPLLIFFDSASCKTNMERVWSYGRVLTDSAVLFLLVCLFVRQSLLSVVGKLNQTSVSLFWVCRTSRARAVFLTCAAFRRFSNVRPQNEEKCKIRSNFKVLEPASELDGAHFESDSAYRDLETFLCPYAFHVYLTSKQVKKQFSLVFFKCLAFTWGSLSLHFKPVVHRFCSILYTSGSKLGGRAKWVLQKTLQSC